MRIGAAMAYYASKPAGSGCEEGFLQPSAPRCWCRHRFDPRCRFPLIHPIGRDTRSVQRFQPLYPGAAKVGSQVELNIGGDMAKHGQVYVENLLH